MMKKKPLVGPREPALRPQMCRLGEVTLLLWGFLPSLHIGPALLA